MINLSLASLLWTAASAVVVSGPDTRLDCGPIQPVYTGNFVELKGTPIVNGTNVADWRIDLIALESVTNGNRLRSLSHPFDSGGAGVVDQLIDDGGIFGVSDVVMYDGDYFFSYIDGDDQFNARYARRSGNSWSTNVIETTRNRNITNYKLTTTEDGLYGLYFDFDRDSLRVDRMNSTTGAFQFVEELDAGAVLDVFGGGIELHLAINPSGYGRELGALYQRQNGQVVMGMYNTGTGNFTPVPVFNGVADSTVEWSYTLLEDDAAWAAFISGGNLIASRIDRTTQAVENRNLGSNFSVNDAFNFGSITPGSGLGKWLFVGERGYALGDDNLNFAEFEQFRGAGQFGVFGGPIPRPVGLDVQWETDFLFARTNGTSLSFQHCARDRVFHGSFEEDTQIKQRFRLNSSALH